MMIKVVARTGWPVALAMILGAVAGVISLGHQEAPQDRHLTIRARQYAYDPAVLRVNQGDRLHITLISQDVVHGFYLEGHDLDAQVEPQQQKIKVRHPDSGGDWKDQDEITVVAGRPGKYRFRCSHTCGSMHPFMSGELVIEPNHTLHAGVGASVGMLLGLGALQWRRLKKGEQDVQC